jgi:uncharacterized cofD-like protein
VRAVVAIGGGHGLSRALAALARAGCEPTAVVTVADDGGSSGRLRRDLGIIAPGDMRMALVTLARNRALARVLAHRFERGELEGHALGNLLLVALAEQAGGDFEQALEAAAKLLDCAGRVLPACTEPVQLRARVSGTEIGGQARVASATGRIERVWLSPATATASPRAVEALERADAVVLGPGSLFTSIVATLLVPALRDALLRSRARVAYVANITTQPGETAGLDAHAHVEALVDHVPGLVVDVAVVHDGPAMSGQGTALAPDLEHPAVRRVLRADVAARDASGAPTWGHDVERLAAVLDVALGEARLERAP